MAKNQKKGAALSDENLDKASGGYKIYHRKENVEIYDNDGELLATTWANADADRIAQNSNVSNMEVTPKDMSDLRKNGFFNKNGVRYYKDGHSTPLSSL